jgi:hypothetical protein
VNRVEAAGRKRQVVRGAAPEVYGVTPRPREPPGAFDGPVVEIDAAPVVAEGMKEENQVSGTASHVENVAGQGAEKVAEESFPGIEEMELVVDREIDSFRGGELHGFSSRVHPTGNQGSQIECHSSATGVPFYPLATKEVKWGLSPHM